MCPDWLRKHAPYVGDKVSDESADVVDIDEDTEAEQRWLMSCMRLILSTDDDKEISSKCKIPENYRLATVWFLLALDTYLQHKCRRGLEAFSSPGTLAACIKMLDKKATDADTERLTKLMANQRFPWEWMGLHIDTWSVGTCAANACRWGFALKVEPIYDGLHGVHRCVFKALDLAGKWYIFLILKYFFTFNWAPWNGGKYQEEMRVCLEEAYTLCPVEMRKLFQLFVPGIANDKSDPMFVHDAIRQEAHCKGVPTSKVCTVRGPKMSIGGWMSYFRGIEYWDVLHNTRGFALTAFAVRRGEMKGKFGSLSVALDQSLGADGHDKKSKDKAASDIAALKKTRSRESLDYI